MPMIFKSLTSETHGPPDRTAKANRRFMATDARVKRRKRLERRVNFYHFCFLTLFKKPQKHESPEKKSARKLIPAAAHLGRCFMA
jgi:hypothetical protein